MTSIGDGSSVALAQLKTERDTLKAQIDMMFEDAHQHPRHTARNWARIWKEKHPNFYQGDNSG